jgi:hypothetical protein
MKWECPKDVTEVTMIVFKKQHKTTNFNEHHNRAKIVARIPRRRIERKREDVL